jgi:hypothetical protein
MILKRIRISKHALEQMKERGAEANEVEKAIRSGEEFPAKKNRRAFRLNFQYDNLWGGKFYRTKQVIPIIVEESNAVVVVTVYVFYF